MIKVIHGSDIVSSRKKLTDILESSEDEKIVLDGKKTTKEDIINSCESNSLFSIKKIVVVENFFSGQLSAEKKTILEYLQKLDTANYIVFWQNKKILKTTLNKYFSKESIHTYDLPEIMFKFCDSLGLQHVQTLDDYMSSLRKSHGDEFIYAMIIRQFRILLTLSDTKGLKSCKLASWQIRKLQNQLNRFSKQDLMRIYRQLLNIDARIKKGLTPYSLSQLLDIFLVSL